MTVVLPHPVGLPDPPGTPAALAQVVDQLTSAGFSAGLTVHLLEPAAVLSGWQGADARVAAAEIGTAVSIAADLHGVLTTAGARLADHHELWLSVAATAARLRQEQRADFASAGARLAVLVGPAAESGLPSTLPAEALALVRAVAEREAGRAAEHRALLEALADDAAAAAAALAAATVPFGGSGRPEDAAAVTARLAVQLPGWGAGALAALGGQAAEELTRPGPFEELDAAVARWGGYAALPGFADGLVGALGADGVGWLLTVIGGRAGTGEAEPLAAMLAAALGAGSGSGGRTDVVLADLRLAPEDPDAAIDGMATGMAAVLAVPGASAAVAALWGSQALAREQSQGTRAGDGRAGGASLPDPVDAALAVLARAGDPAAAARLLGEPQAWRRLLSRTWSGGTADLAAVVALAGTAPAAGQAARSALLALGQGLHPGGGDRVLDDQAVLAGIRVEVTGLVAGQPGVLLPVLDAAATGVASDDAERALRGLGHLVAEQDSAAEVTEAVAAALRAGQAGAYAGEVAGAHVAVLEYGQRLRYALAWSRAAEMAVDRQMFWTFATTPLLTPFRGFTGDLVDVGADVVAEVLDMNGDVEVGPDTGSVRTDDDAARFAVATLEPAPVPGASVSKGDAARVGFARAAGLLGRLSAPEETLLDRIGELPMPDAHRPGRPR